MRQTWVISDTHFGHAKILGFKGSDRKPIRSFTSVDEMDDFMIDSWNSVVSPEDKVYHLGDIIWKHGSLDLIRELSGHIRLISGNHDIFGAKQYLKAGIKAIYGMKVIEHEDQNVVLTHCPVHDSVLQEPRFKCNIHGHIHNNPSPKGNYYNVSVENIDYKPITLETAVSRALK